VRCGAGGPPYIGRMQQNTRFEFRLPAERRRELAALAAENDCRMWWHTDRGTNGNRARGLFATAEDQLRLHQLGERLVQFLLRQPATPLSPMGCNVISSNPLSLSEIKSGRIACAILRGAGWPRCGQRPEQHATLVHPCSAIGACERHCNIFGTIPVGGEGAARRTQRHGQGNPVGSNR
jgi:hypothetical protein